MTNAHDPQELRRLAERQHGNVTTRQLLAAGLTRSTIDTRVRSGLFVRRHHGVYAVGHVPSSRASRWHAGVLALGDDARLSHRAASSFWEILRGGVPTEITVPTRNGHARRDGIIVHRMALPREHVTARDGIPVTTLVRTVLDVATVISEGQFRGVFEEAQVQHHLSPEVLAAEAICRRGHRGVRRIWAVLEEAVDPEGIESVLELRFAKLCDRFALPQPVVNEPLGPWRPDFLWPGAGVVVETDGGRFHRTAAKRKRDAKKDAYLQAQGLRVIRLEWAEVTARPEATAALMRDALQSGR